jgi:hypothetical protein
MITHSTVYHICDSSIASGYKKKQKYYYSSLNFELLCKEKKSWLSDSQLRETTYPKMKPLIAKLSLNSLNSINLETKIESFIIRLAK